MKRTLVALLAICGALTATDAGTDVFVTPTTNGLVVLLHGLARSADSMSKMAAALQVQGYRVCNVDYPSREHSIGVLAEEFVAPAIAKCFPDTHEPINFVTHSLGGIIVRQLAASGELRNVGRVVMLSPPNHGSEVVDKLANWPLFDWLNGPAGKDLGTQMQATPSRLGPARFELGIVTGARSINPFLSMMIPGNDDGKVAVDHAKLDGMTDFIVLRCSHPFIMKSDRAIEQTVYFLQHGLFATRDDDCWD